MAAEKLHGGNLNNEQKKYDFSNDPSQSIFPVFLITRPRTPNNEGIL